jgi:hypothetical protein
VLISVFRDIRRAGTARHGWPRACSERFLQRGRRDDKEHVVCPGSSQVIARQVSLSGSRRAINSDDGPRQTNGDDLNTKDGISLLSVKHHLLLSYILSLTLLSAHRVLGHSLADRSTPSGPFSSLDRGLRGSNAGDLVDSMVEARVVLEKVKALESRMKYQIEKLVKIAQETPSSQQNIIDGELVLRRPLLRPISHNSLNRSTCIPSEPSEPHG